MGEVSSKFTSSGSMKFSVPANIHIDTLEHLITVGEDSS